MFHLAAFRQSVNPAGVLVNINAVQDQVLTTQNADLRIPNGYNQLIGAMALINDASAARAQLDSPSLRTVFNVDVEPLLANITPAGLQMNYTMPDTPLPLVVNESLNFQMQSAPVGAVEHVGLVMLGDGPIAPVKGNIFTIRATTAIQQAAGVWTNGNITLGQVLPAGSYQVVGMRVRGVGLIAARLVFVGGTTRPGVAAVQAVTDPDWRNTRFGSIGVLGQFDNTTPPTLDVIGGAAAAQVLLLDLIKVK